MTSDQLRKFAERYAEAWSSQNPNSVSAFYANGGTISVNGGAATPIADVARGFFRDFPDTVVTLDRLESRSDGTAFHWTLIGTNTGPGGTGNRVRISGYELWKIDNAGLVAESKGHFDAADYERQLRGSDK